MAVAFAILCVLVGAFIAHEIFEYRNRKKAEALFQKETDEKFNEVERDYAGISDAELLKRGNERMAKRGGKTQKE